MIKNDDNEPKLFYHWKVGMLKRLEIATFQNGNHFFELLNWHLLTRTAKRLLTRAQLTFDLNESSPRFIITPFCSSNNIERIHSKNYFLPVKSFNRLCWSLFLFTIKSLWMSNAVWHFKAAIIFHDLFSELDNWRV